MKYNNLFYLQKGLSEVNLIHIEFDWNGAIAELAPLQYIVLSLYSSGEVTPKGFSCWISQVR